MYSATVSSQDSAGLILRCFLPEDRKLKGARYKLALKGKKCVFSIRAQSSGALRTVMNSITKMLTVIEKMKGV